MLHGKALKQALQFLWGEAIQQGVIVIICKVTCFNDSYWYFEVCVGYYNF
jgi:hypothetical protein